MFLLGVRKHLVIEAQIISAQAFGPQTLSPEMAGGVVKTYLKNAGFRKQMKAAIPALKKNASAVNEVRKYVAERAGYYGYVLKNDGLKATSAQVMDDMRLDGYGAILDVVSDNLVSLVPIIIIIAMVPFVSWQVIQSFNESELPTEWTGGLQAADVWVTASLLLGAIVTISLVIIVLVQLKKFKNAD